jgi:hypothetical protein
MHQIFLELDGNLLRRRLFGCHLNKESSQVSHNYKQLLKHLKTERSLKKLNYKSVILE